MTGDAKPGDWTEIHGAVHIAGGHCCADTLRCPCGSRLHVGPFKSETCEHCHADEFDPPPVPPASRATWS